MLSQKETDGMCYHGKKTGSMCYHVKKTDSVCYHGKKSDSMCYHGKKTDNICYYVKKTDSLCYHGKETVPPRPSLQKKNVFGQKQVTRNLLVHSVFFWMIILITPEMNIIEYQFNSTSWSLFSLKKTKGIRYNTFHMFDYVYLQTSDFLL